MKPSFSVVLIAKNEEHTLPRLLKSLTTFKKRGGEIIVVDTGSTDGTEGVAALGGAEFIPVGDKFVEVVDAFLAQKVSSTFCVSGDAPVLKAGDRIFDFAAARNYAAKIAKNDMIAMPDCDEVYTQLDLVKVEQAIQEGAERLEYDFVFAHDEFGRPLTQFKHSKFYDRRKLRWEGVIHEVLVGDAKQFSLDSSVIRLEHFQNKETNRDGYLRGLALDCYHRRDKDRNSHYFARELYYTGRYRSAIREFCRHIDMNGWAAERGQSAVFKGLCFEKLGQDLAAQQCYYEALNIDASRREPWMRLAWLAFKHEDAQRVASFAEAALAVKTSGYYADNQEDYRHVPHMLLYWSYPRLGDEHKALHHYNEAYRYAPENEVIKRDREWFYPAGATPLATRRSRMKVPKR